jgi:hypothetical protein
MNTQDLVNTMLSLKAAGRDADAATVARAIQLINEVGEWAACLKCGMAYEYKVGEERPLAALDEHRRRTHR